MADFIAMTALLVLFTLVNAAKTGATANLQGYGEQTNQTPPSLHGHDLYG